MARRNRNNGLDLSGVGGRRLNVGGGSRPKSGLSFAGGSNIGSASPKRGMDAGMNFGGGRNGSGRGGSKKTLVYIVIGVILAFALAIGVGVVVYKQTAKNALKPVVDSGISSALVAPVEDKVQWGLLVVRELEEDDVADDTVENAALVSFDPANLKIAYIWIPANLRIYVAGYGYKSVSETFDMCAQPAFVQACSEATGVQFSHYFEATSDGIDKYAEELGVSSGSSKETLALEITKKVLGSSSEQQELFSTYIGCDMDKSTLSEFIAQFRGMDVKQHIFNEDMPLESELASENYVQIKANDWATLQKRIGEGLDPIAGKEEIAKNKKIRSNTRVTIWNGVGVSGIAGDCQDFLEKKGWEIESTGNAQSFVYDETLIVYNWDSDQPTAELLVSDLGQGRAVRSAARYSFEGDILVVVGKDYQPF